VTVVVRRYQGCPPDVAHEWHDQQGRTCSAVPASASARVQGDARPWATTCLAGKPPKAARQP
jgi:hypothetical protein